MYRMHVMLTWLFLASGGILMSQTRVDSSYQVNGKIASENVEDVVVNIYNSQNELIKTEITDKDGNYLFSDLVPGIYRITVSKNGEENHSESFTLSDNLSLPTISINHTEKKIEGVIITKTSAKLLIQREDGKLILNVESAISSSGGSAFDTLEKAPGVSVDANDNISLRGKNNVLVQIDGKNTSLTGADLANYLRGMASANIEKIEFITNPSSKYDAAGSSIINIILKKNKRKGTNGNISISAGSGRYFKNNNSFSINHRNNKVNYFLNYSFNYRDHFSNLILDRNFYEDGKYQMSYLQDNYMRVAFRNHSIKTGLDYYLDDKNILGVSFGWVNNNFNPAGDNIADVLDANRQLSGRFGTTSLSKNNQHNFSVNLSHKYTSENKDLEITTDVDYITYQNTSLQNFDTRTYDLSGQLVNIPYLLEGDIDSKLNIYSLKSDLRKTFENNWTMEAGLKTSFVKSDNDMKFFDKSNGSYVLDGTKSNHFVYEENINALYGNLTKKWDKWTATAGLRMENSNITGNQLTTNEINKKNYTQWFPSLLLSYQMNENNNLEINFSRRITRPSYNQLNPFKFYLDPTTYKTRNPYLDPQTTQNYELTYAYKGKYIATLSYSRISNNITDVLKPVMENGESITVQTNDNLTTVSYYSLFLMAPIKIAKWWDMSNSLNLYYGSYTGIVSDTQINNKGNLTLYFNSVNSFKFGNGYSAEISGNYQAREVYAFMDVRPQWQVNFGAQKKFGKNATLKFSVTDLFWSFRIEAQTKFNSYIENFNVKRDTRSFMLSFSYNFGGEKSATRKTGGADDLQRRAN